MSAQPFVLTHSRITFVGSASGSTSATLPTHQAGDAIIAFSYRRASATPPTLPSGWTNVTDWNNTLGTVSVAARIAYVVAAGSGTSSGTWTNATYTLFVVYRNAAMPPAQHAWAGGTTTGIVYPGLASVDRASWAVLFGCHASAWGDITTGFASEGWTEREHQSGVGQAAAADSAGAIDGTTSPGFTGSDAGDADSYMAAQLEVRSAEAEEWASYTVPSRTRSFARSLESVPSGALRVAGDLLETPTPVIVRVHVTGSSLANAMASAYNLIESAEGATSIRTHAGSQDVRGILGYEIEPVGTDALVTLTFAPIAAGVYPVVGDVTTKPSIMLATQSAVADTADGLGATGTSVAAASESGSAEVVEGAVDGVTYDSASVTFSGSAVTFGSP